MRKMFAIMLTPDYHHNGSGTVEAARAAGSPFVVVALPWEMIAPHEKQAYINHSQTLERLDERGGLSACEALAVIEDRPWRRMPCEVANQCLARRVRNWYDGQACIDIGRAARKV